MKDLYSYTASISSYVFLSDLTQRQQHQCHGLIYDIVKQGAAVLNKFQKSCQMAVSTEKKVHEHRNQGSLVWVLGILLCRSAVRVENHF
jgi:hypothetical protein